MNGRSAREAPVERPQPALRGSCTRAAPSVRILVNSSRIRSGDTTVTSGASRWIARRVSGSMAKPSRAAKRTARSMRSLSSANRCPGSPIARNTLAPVLVFATVLGVGLGMVLGKLPRLEKMLNPFVIATQVVPKVALVPLFIVWFGFGISSKVVIATILAFFPILSNTTIGLRSADHNLQNLFDLYGASSWQKLWHLKLKAALPYFLGGLKIAGGLALIGAVVAEIAAGSAGAGSGLAYRIVESQFRLNIPRLFAALALLSITGILIFLSLSALSHLLLRKWHESALEREN